MLGKLVGPVLVVAAALALSCSNSKPLVNQNDPFNDPFFHDGMNDGTSALDEVLNEPAPSVGWLAGDHDVPPAGVGADGDPASGKPPLDANGEGVLLKAEGDGSYVPHQQGSGDGGDEDTLYGHDQKSFYDKASEATLATMSILMGAGMAALPFLIGT